MRRYRWTLYKGSRCIDVGTVEAKDEREAIGQVLLDRADQVDPEGNYRVEAGGMSMSSEGRDFRRSAGAAGWGRDQKEDQLKRGRYLFEDDPVFDVLDTDSPEGKAAIDRMIKAGGKAAEALRKAGVVDCGKTLKDCAWDLGDSDRQREFNRLLGSCGPIPPCSDGSTNHDMNDETAHPQTGEIHAQCRHCGLIDPKGTGRILRDPSLPRGTDRIVGRALHGAKKGEELEIILNPEFGGGVHRTTAEQDIPINEGIRIGAGGGAYRPPHVQEIVDGVAEKVARSMVRAISKIVGKANLQCDKCGNNFEVELPGTGPWSGVPCPHCAVTYTFEHYSS